MNDTPETLLGTPSERADSTHSPGSACPTPEQIDAYVALGHRLRAQAMARHTSLAAAALTSRLRRLFARPTAAREAVRGDLRHDLMTPLTAIRANSELLIDNPDMPQEHRRRFLDSIHEETLRLERSIGAIVGPAGATSRA